MVSLQFFIYMIRPHYGSGVESASNRNEYQEYFLGYRRPVRRADNLTTFICRLSWNLGASASWNHQGLSRPVTGSLLTINIPKSSKFWRISGAVRTSSSHKSSLVSSWTAFYIAICFDCKVIIIGNSNSTFKPHQFLAFIHYTVVRCC